MRDSREKQSPLFPTTSWTVVSAAGRQSTGAFAALSKICAEYWYPIYAFIRRKGYARAEAEDLCQAFFAQILQNGGISQATRERGRFRSFLLASLTNFLANEWHRSQASKRGGSTTMLSIDFEDGEMRYCNEPRHDLTPQALYEREWALTLIDGALKRLREEYLASGREAQFGFLAKFLSGDHDRGDYDQLSQDLQISNAAARTAVYRLRRRYAELIRAELTAIVTEPDEVDEEIRFLVAALGAP